MEYVTSAYAQRELSPTELEAADLPSIAGAPAESDASPVAPPASGSISDAELLLWLQEKTREMYGQVRELMGMSSRRGDLIQDLTALKNMLDAAPDPAAAAAEIDRLEAAYAGTPYEQDLHALLDPVKERVGQVLGAVAAGVNAAYLPLSPTWEKASADLQGEIDALGRDDQLALVQIQSAMSDIREATQLASNLLANQQQASDTVVGNLRG